MGFTISFFKQRRKEKQFINISSLAVSCKKQALKILLQNTVRQNETIICHQMLTHKTEHKGF